MAKKWLEVNTEGLRELVAARPKSFIVRELVQNAWDEKGVTKVDVKISSLGGSKYELVVEDDAPEGFYDTSHAYTIYAETRKRKDPSLRGRFNLGEKEVLALCEEARLITTSQGIVFKADGSRSWTKERRARGSSFSGVIRFSKDEFEEICRTVKTFIPPKGIKTTFNGKQLPERAVLKTIYAHLETELSVDGVMRSSRRGTTVDILEPLDGEEATLYEMGLPVIATGDQWHYNVNQRVPLTTDRDNVKPSYLRDLRAEVLNAMSEQMHGDELAEEWVRDAMDDERIVAETTKKVVQEQQGKKIFLRDLKDPQANERAMALGFDVVPPRAYSKATWENIRKSPGLLPLSTDLVGKTKHGKCKLIPEEEWTDGMIRVSGLARFVAQETMGIKIIVNFVQADSEVSVSAQYGRRRLQFNVTVLTEEWFEPLCSEEQLDLIIHEIGHEDGGHLTMEYHSALTKIGAKLALMDPEKLKKAVSDGKRPKKDLEFVSLFDEEDEA